MKKVFIVVFISIMVVGVAVSRAQMAPLPLHPSPEPPAQPGNDMAERSEVEQIYLPGAAAVRAPVGIHALTPGSRFQETEPNNTRAEANPLPGNNIMVLGNIYPNADVDYFSFTATAGSRVYAAVITSFSATGGGDSTLNVLDYTGGLIEKDDNDGSFGANSSSIAGAELRYTGTYYLEVQHIAANTQIRPYTLYVKVQSGAPVPEVEPNSDANSANSLPDSGWVSGSISAGDADFYSLSLNEGDTVFLSLDMDPERDTVTWNGRVGLGIFNNMYLVANDTNTISPNSEAFVITVKSSGTYYIYVDESASGAGNTYHLSASVIPKETYPVCGWAFIAPYLSLADNGTTQSTLTINAGSATITDLNVHLNITHDYMPDLDVTLTAPDGNVVGLFNDIGGTGIGLNSMDLVLDDEAAIPFAFTVVSGLRLQPEYANRLSWFDGQKATGDWKLTIADDTPGNTGTLNSWSLTVCQPAPLPVCQKGFAPKVIFSTDFEANNGGFTSSGTANEWEWGTPAFAPITTCASGSKCWKTDLDNTYDASSSQDLTSPTIDLTQYVAPVMLNWSQKYQMEAAQYDHANVSIFETSPGMSRSLWEWMDATMAFVQGAATIQESAGWGAYTRDISAYAGKKIQVRYRLDSDVTGNYAGLAVDDFSITACVPSLYLPAVLRAP